MLKGYDVSHWNTIVPMDADFIIAKASEGAIFKDKTFNQHLTSATGQYMLVGAYHFAKTNTDVMKNVDNFIECISKRGELGHTMILALDIEGEDAKRKDAWKWCKQWLDEVYKRTGIKPVVYTNAANVKNLKEIADADYGLWVAHWGVDKPTIKPYKFWALWQYSAKGIDKDYFNGTVDQYIAYCKKNKED